MSRTANPYDNAFAESFFSTIKREEVHQQTYHSLEEVQQRLASFLHTYNTQRLHSSLGYLSP